MLNSKMTRRTFTTRLAASAVAAATLPETLFAATHRNIHIGHTGITWLNSQVEQAIQDVAKLGFYGFETFGEVLAAEEAKGGIGRVLEQNKIPLISGYCTLNLTDPEKRRDEMAKAVAWCKLIKKYNGRIFVLGPNQVHRDTYVYADHKANIVSTLNEAAKVVQDQGLTPVLHQHTGTCVMTRDETYATLDAVDTHVLKFGPDVGQLTKGGVNAVQVVKDYLPLVQHMHLKDYNGKDDHLLGYCPLGQGQVDVPAILDLLKGRKLSGMVMTELDNDPRNLSPTPPIELVEQSKTYLKKIGVKFRT
ncbi:sugar phosphate isomerase/epimerase family protein [Paracidobacterium acidisoli]|uniref:sugar phosphate isomerase/epimerase family protein n=1 Tax=Paracidobacterium acidisoli TaxID=2303751 RepID=UPI0013144B4A|nr:sugar phosphate isomerase/epimerase [Paracidobacterium acidisoli]MBT9330816.1 sugar phosphate isomerase/epimerase [Paracidobacterium acidisoli]